MSKLISDESQELLTEMRDSGEICCIDISSDFNYVWDVSLVRFSEDSHTHEKPAGSYEDLNEAIRDLYAVWKGTYEDEVFKWIVKGREIEKVDAV